MYFWLYEFLLFVTITFFFFFFFPYHGLPLYSYFPLPTDAQCHSERRQSARVRQGSVSLPQKVSN